MNKRIVSICFSTIIALTLSTQTGFASFSDISESHFYKDAIEFLQDAGVVKGYDDGTFRPDNLISKAEFLKMAFNQSGYAPPERLYKTPFRDVDPGSYYSAFVKKGLEMDIINFNPETPIYLPASPISRIEAIKMIMKIKGIPTPYVSEKTGSLFEDIESSSPDFHIIHSAEKTNIFISTEFPLFLPHRSLKRGEAAELIYLADQYAQSLNFIAPHQLTSLQDENVPTDLSQNSKFPLFVNVWNKIHSDYLHTEQLDDNKLVYGAISGMVQSLKDPHSIYKNPDQASDLTNIIEGNYEGIGIAIDLYEEKVLIISVFEGSPAQEAGLEPGDIIERIDRKDIIDYTVEEVVNAIKGPAGTTVMLTVNRDGTKITKEIKRQNIQMDTVLFQAKQVDIPEEIEYISIQQFTENTGREFDNVLSRILESEPKGLIIDLRDNPGGYTSSTFEVLGRFIPEGNVIAKIKMGGLIFIQDSFGDGKLNNMPIAVLVNSRTASAAEIMAGALQDYEVATIIGDTTFGKGTVQEVNIFTDGSLLKLTIAQWLTPNDRDINHKGLTPDILIKETKNDVLGEGDTQLQKAIEELQKQI